MRILHVSAYYAPAFVYGGPPRSIHGLCRALTRAGADLQVFTTDANGAGVLPAEVTRAGVYDGVQVRYFPRSWPSWPIGSRALVAALRTAVRAVDVLHVHGLWNRVVWAAVREAQSAGIPYVLSPRGMLEDAAVAHRGWRKRAAHLLIQRRILTDAALLHATSPREAESLRRQEAATRVIVVPNGIDLAEPETPAALADAGVAPGGPFILVLGRIHPIKRLDLAIDAFVLLRTRHPGVRLVVAGPDEGHLRAGLETRAGAAAGDILWTGGVDAGRRDALLRQAAALMVCSDSESFGMTVLEAMAADLPVVVTDTCGWAELVAAGAGIRVEQHPQALAEALSGLLTDPAEGRRMGARGRDLAERVYRWDGIARTFLREYEAVAATRAAGAVS